MKKIISLLISLMMILSALSALSAIPVFADGEGMGDAENDTFDAVGRSLDLIPDDPFDGDSDKIENPDGSTTYLFKNGSVVTEYKDGSQDGVDYNGNHHYYDKKDDTTTAKIKDGSTFTEYSDGKKAVTLPGGMNTVVVNPDSTTSLISQRTGTVKEYDSEGHCTGLGFVGSDERLKTDEYGDLLDGKISGPNGASLEIKDGGSEKHLVSPDGLKVDYTETGVTDSSEGRTESYTVTHPDGKKEMFDVTTKVERDKSGVHSGYTAETSGGFYYPNGDKIEFEEKMQYDKDGDPYYSANNVAQYTGSDGKTLWIDKNTGAYDYNDPNTGEKIVVDEKGNLTEFKNDEIDHKAQFNSDGSIKTADIRTRDGARMTARIDGSVKVILPDGDVYESDGRGNVTKNGEQIKKNGEWVPGYNPLADIGKAGTKNKKNTDDVDTDEIETDDVDTDEVETDEIETDEVETDEIETDEPEDTEETEDTDETDDTEDDEEGLSAERVAGSYSVSGKSVWIDFDDPEYSGEESGSMTFTFTAHGEKSLDFTLEGGEFDAAPYDPKTGKVDFVDPTDGFVIHVRFSEEGKTIRVKMDFDYNYEDGRTYGSYTGTKN